MNFDGTYPGTNKYEKGKLLECKEPEKPPALPPRPPVRVVVSYPQHEEWDGKTTDYCCGVKRNIIIAVIVTCTLIGIAVAGYFIYRSGSLDKSLEDGLYFAQMERPDDEALRRYLINDITKHYQQKRDSLARDDQLAYFTREQARLEKNEIDVFLKDLDIKSPVVLPEDKGMNLDIADFVRNYLHKTKAWLSRFVKEEIKLASYNFQKNRKEESLRMAQDPLRNLSTSEREDLLEIRKLYTKAPSVREDNGTVYVDAKVLLFSEAISIIESISPKRIYMVVLTSSLIYMDSNFTKNIHLGIFSPNWIMNDNILITLSGEDVIDPSPNVKDGSYGQHGKDGGFFFAVGLSLDFTKITVISKGGNPGSGHDGPDGKNGTANLRPVITTQNPKCLVQEGRELINPAGERILRFQIFADDACGEAGGPGGLPGMPGLGGRILFITPQNTTYRMDKDSSSGRRGRTGVNGTSSTLGCYFSAYRITSLLRGASYKWSPITSVTCNNHAQAPILANQHSVSPPAREKQNMTTYRQLFIQHISRRARDGLSEGNNSDMFELLKFFEISPMLAGLTNVSTPIRLFEEFNAIYNQYTNVEIFKSFLNKVKQALKNGMENASPNDDDQIALKYLQLAVYSKITQLSTTFGEYYIVDIAKYIDKTLEAVKNIDVEVFKTKNISKPGLEIQQKLVEYRKSLQQSEEMTCDGTKTNETDGRIMCLISTIDRTLPNLVDIVYHTLLDTSSDGDYLAINRTIEEYIQLRQIYYMSAFSHITLKMPDHGILGEPKTFVENALVWNRTIAEPILACAEMMVLPEQCKPSRSILTRWEIFKEMDTEIIKAYKTFDKSDPLESITTTLKIILSYVRETRPISRRGRENLMNLRSSVLEFTQLISKCQKIMEETQLERRVAEIQGLKVPKSVQLAKVVGKTKEIIVMNMLWYHYKKTYYAFQQWAYPYTNVITEARPNANKEELILEIRAIKDELANSKATLQEKDAHIKLADFLLTSATGPFFSWRNTDYKALIVELLKGHRVQMRAGLEESSHVPLKQAVKFRTVEFALSGIPSSILLNFAVELTHSGFSHFLYNSTVYTAVGPQVELFHSFDVARKGDKPSVINQVYKKIKSGDIMLSPFTTWTVQLQAVNNRAKFQELLKYSNVTSVHLVGTGWYTTHH